MEVIVVKKTVQAPLAAVWDSWDDFGNIALFNPNLKASSLLGDSPTPTGEGTRRECELKDGKNYLRERIVGYEKHRRMVVDVYESSMPIKSMLATIEFRAISDSITEVSFTARFAPKGGVLGKLIGPVMRRQFTPMLQAALDGNAAYVERGVTIADAA